MLENLDTIQLARMRQYKLQQDFLYFVRYFFQQREGQRFLLQPHHRIIANALAALRNGTHKNLLINVPPGAGKTELAVIQFIAHSLAINPAARFLHISASEELATLNAAKIRELLQSTAYQEYFPLHFKADRAAKHHWAVTSTEGGSEGGLYATSLGGQITGFRAGRLEEGFSGAIIIDDPQKPDDVLSNVKREAATRKLLHTVKTRKAAEHTPMIVIMQRLHEQDVSQFILDGGLDMPFHHVCIPAITRQKGSRKEISYWEEKEPLAQLRSMRKTSPSLFYGQYQQKPISLEAEIFDPSWWQRYDSPPALQYAAIFADTAMKTGRHADYSVLQCWGMGEDGKAYLLEQVRGRWEWPELEAQALEFWQRCQQLKLCPLRYFAVEDKVAGTSLLQALRHQHHVPVKAIPRTRAEGSKLKRALDIQHIVSTGLVCLPKHKPWLQDLLHEATQFPKAEHDDQVDAMVDALHHFFLQPTKRAMPTITLKGMY